MHGAEKYDRWIVDIKDIHPVIYEKYTGKKNRDVISNLKKLLETVPEMLLNKVVQYYGEISTDGTKRRQIEKETPWRVVKKEDIG